VLCCMLLLCPGSGSQTVRSRAHRGAASGVATVILDCTNTESVLGSAGRGWSHVATIAVLTTHRSPPLGRLQERCGTIVGLEVHTCSIQAGVPCPYVPSVRRRNP